jgi:1-acyl-sn-glycerol-3-phosphate acyltransferase
MPITIRISKPLDFTRYADRPTDPLVLRQITDEIMFELKELGGQEYVNQYAKRKADTGAEAAASKVASVPIDVTPAAEAAEAVVSA